MKHSTWLVGGFRIGKDTTNLYEGEFDNLFVRGRMTFMTSHKSDS